MMQWNIIDIPLVLMSRFTPILNVLDIPICNAAYFLSNTSKLTMSVIGSYEPQFIPSDIILQSWTHFGTILLLCKAVHTRNLGILHHLVSLCEWLYFMVTLALGCWSIVFKEAVGSINAILQQILMWLVVFDLFIELTHCTVFELYLFWMYT